MANDASSLPNIKLRCYLSTSQKPKFNEFAKFQDMAHDFPPSAIRLWMHKLKNGGALSTTTLQRLLSDMSIDEGQLVVENAIKAGLLVTHTKSKGKRLLLSFHKNLKSIPRRVRDFYCFECHLPGPEMLRKCNSCARSFHEACQRQNPQKPNYEVPSDKGQPHRLPLNESDLENELEQHKSRTATPAAEPMETNNNTITPISDCSSAQSKVKHESDDEVEFIGEIPAPTRHRKQQELREQIKTEIQATLDATSEDAAEAISDLKLCTACRLLKLSVLHNPPYMDKAELAYLLGFSWKTYHSWLHTDVNKYMAKHWSQYDAALVKRMLFINEPIGLADIAANIKAQKYSYLMEFHIDLLDLQHTVGVFFGTKCEEYDATKWLLRDISHDMREILRCPDCFRYSSEPHKSAVWFAKPCRQRHELVYAKHRGWPHWPAKVIRVLSAHKKYDVRFFGGTHSRALIPTRDIQPIDTDISNIKLKSSRALAAAMRELEFFKALSRCSISYFDFHADPHQSENLIQTVLSPYVQAEELGVLPQLRAAKRTAKRSAPASVPPKRLRPMRRCSIASRSEALLDINASRRSSMDTQSQSGRTWAEYHEMAREIMLVNEKLRKCKAELAQVQREVLKVKQKRWCQQCQQEALFDCCFVASYCSKECQRSDSRRHQLACRKDENRS